MPPQAQAQWAIEDPSSVPDGDPADPSTWVCRLSSVSDPDVIYQVVISQPSANVEVIAEYRRDDSKAAGYESRDLKGSYQGEAVRSLAPADGPTVGKQFVLLETVLTPKSGSEPAMPPIIEYVSSASVFKDFKSPPKVTLAPPAQITKCVLRTDSETDLPPAAITALSALADQSDVSFAIALRQILTQTGGTRYAEACIGLEELSELPCDASIDIKARTITWKGPMSADQETTLGKWGTISLFGQTFTDLVSDVRGFKVETTFAADPANPTSIAGVGAGKLTVTPTSLIWNGLFAAPAPVPPDSTEQACADRRQGRSQARFCESRRRPDRQHEDAGNCHHRHHHRRIVLEAAAREPGRS